jgi:hypothetical protein
MNKVYGFEGEAKAKYGDMTYKLFADVFTARMSILDRTRSIKADKQYPSPYS